MSLTTEDVRKIADLARLDLSVEELEAQCGHINRLLERFDELQAIDVEGVDPTHHCIPTVNVLRVDEVRPSFDRDDLLATAPEAQDGRFVVPRVIGG